MWAKLGRAEELLNRLNNEVRLWNEFEPYRLVHQRDDESRTFRVVAHIRREPEIVRWSLMFADVVHNLRSTLDHLIWAILSYEYPAGVPADADKIDFPIWDSPPKPTANLRRAIDAYLSSSVRTVIEFVQPCSGLNRWGIPVHPLSFIRDFDNRDKHRLLYLAMSAVAFGRMRLRYEQQHNNDIPTTEIHTGEIKDGTTLISAKFLASHPEMEQYFDGCLVIALFYPQRTAIGSDRDEYAALAEVLIGAVKWVIDAFISVVK